LADAAHAAFWRRDWRQSGRPAHLHPDEHRAFAALCHNADTDELVRGIEEGFGNYGISRNDTLVWQLQPYDGIVNWYNPHSHVINLSQLPQDEEIAPYWDNWSETLTGGAWDWRAFFVDETEARIMARFNQFVLGAHEYGHALTYRY